MKNKKNALCKIIVGVLLLGGLFFNTNISETFADITIDQARTILYQEDSSWWSRSAEEQNIKASLYEMSINSGLSHQEALNETNIVYDQMANYNNDSGQMEHMITERSGLSWDYNQNTFQINLTENFQPTVPEEDRNFDYILTQLNNEEEGDILEPLPIDIDEENNDSTETNDPASTTSTTSSGTENSTSTNSSSDVGCPEKEGLEGMKFLFFQGPLVPCGVNKKCAGNNEGLSINKPCTLCHFIVLIQNFFNLLLSLLIIVSIFMLTVAGVLYIISAGGKMTGLAKEIIQKTLLGFGLFLLSWLIVFTLISLLSVNTSMLGKGEKQSVVSIFQFTCDDDSAFYMSQPQGGGSTDTAPVGGGSTETSPGGGG